ncbi:hypothetical protein [Subtercola boreus]|uniref:Uncharacterized protein n=1 Tax=Subtercola boreus TaxID=120213 RepID=A0A3E0WFS2_9MICO|nr:hypothetical protein [Subtercola boreus]RFA22545.1 hypothetical protein B7R24_02660 [Subtercola boreus]RFA22901.1 hypothetical protein B7R23_02655 [Subtercola boreus]RFA28653.1 hypothetical protein B7R25_02670 [Subtercola boreus]
MPVNLVPPASDADSDVRCMINRCDELPTNEVSVASRGQLSRFAVCVEHAHDIDWGVIEPRPTAAARGYLGRSDEPESSQSA